MFKMCIIGVIEPSFHLFIGDIPHWKQIGPERTTRRHVRRGQTVRGREWPYVR